MPNAKSIPNVSGFNLTVIFYSVVVVNVMHLGRAFAPPRSPSCGSLQDPTLFCLTTVVLINLDDCRDGSRRPTLGGGSHFYRMRSNLPNGFSAWKADAKLVEREGVVDICQQVYVFLTDWDNKIVSDLLNDRLVLTEWPLQIYWINVCRVKTGGGGI